MHVGFIGFGLIAGSIARAVRASEAAAGWTMAAWSPRGRGPVTALADGVIDRAPGTPGATLADADMVVLGGPATACLAALDDLAGSWSSSLPPGAVVTDVASTKARLVERADTAGIRFVGGHPMAGLETTGYDAGRADLFVGRPWVVVPGAHAGRDDVERVLALVRACGARPFELDAVVHDRAVAAVSHLPLLLSAALVESVAGPAGAAEPADWPIARELAATGWRDMTRLARGDPEMGAAIAATNATALAERLDALQAVLAAWRSALVAPGGPDEQAIADRLRAATERLRPA
jgi:prephenate dehydrogenase